MCRGHLAEGKIPVPGTSYLGFELVQASASRLFDGAQHFWFPLLQSFKQTLKVLIGTALRELTIFLWEEENFNFTTQIKCPYHFSPQYTKVPWGQSQCIVMLSTGDFSGQTAGILLLFKNTGLTARGSQLKYSGLGQLKPFFKVRLNKIKAHTFTLCSFNI